MANKRKIRLVLGDQLSTSLEIIQEATPDDLIVMAEVNEEAQYVRHHPKKIILLFSAMRHFAQTLREMGLTVEYWSIDDPKNPHSLDEVVHQSLQKHQASTLVCTEPGEHRVLQKINQWSKAFDCTVELKEDSRFLCSLTDFKQWAGEHKSLRMEFFVRWLRQRENILMDEAGKPAGGQWNFDKENRKPFEASQKIPPPTTFENDQITTAVIKAVESRFAHHFGDIHPFTYAVTREMALEVLEDFIEKRLPYFGDFQDAMWQSDPWLFHSHISFYLNCGLLLPRECIDKAQAAWKAKKAPLNAVEGFIRQIAGWREFVRGIYWLNGPDYLLQNALNAKRVLPKWYWGSECKMNCIAQCVQDTKAHAYAHYIQRLMVLGNFALLAGIDPQAVSQWYLEVYADAYEWVESPNVIGMALFADGGVFATKPYAASGAYINKMSNYCKNCHFSIKEKTGPKACPFNYLYWDFVARHEKLFEKNPRMAMPVRTWRKMTDEKQKTIKKDARAFLKDIR